MESYVSRPRLSVLNLLTLALALFVFAGHPALAEAQHNGGLPQFDPTYILTQLFWLTAIFGTFYLLVQGVVVPKVVEVIETRDVKITHDIRLAEAARNEAVKVGKVVEDKIVHARDHARTILQLANREADNVAAARIALVESKIAGRVRDAELRISHARQNALKELPEMAAPLVNEVVTHFACVEIDQPLVSSAIKAAITSRSVQ